MMQTSEQSDWLVLNHWTNTQFYVVSPFYGITEPSLAPGSSTLSSTHTANTSMLSELVTRLVPEGRDAK